MTSPVVYSPFISAIEDWLERCGVRVWFDEPPTDRTGLEPGVAAGLFRHETWEIWVDPGLSAREALMTMAHEAGHWLGYLIHERAESYKREHQAYVYGWHVLRWFNAPISRAEWLEDCRESWRLR